MISAKYIQSLLDDLESDRVERTDRTAARGTFSKLSKKRSI